MQNIIVKPAEMWDYYLKNKTDLITSMHMVAENKEFGTEIYIADDEGYPVVSVHHDDSQMTEEICLSKIHLEEVCEDFYDKFLTSKAPTSIEELLVEINDIPDESDNQFDIDCREYDLDCGIADFVDLATDNPRAHSMLSDEVLNDIKDHFCEYLYRKHGLEIYRPMFLEFEDGKEEFKTYPYPDLAFDDEDNPMYKKEEKK